MFLNTENDPFANDILQRKMLWNSRKSLWDNVNFSRVIPDLRIRNGQEQARELGRVIEKKGWKKLEPHRETLALGT